MNDIRKTFLTIPEAIILGSLLISISILVSSGVIKLKGLNVTNPLTTPNDEITTAENGKSLDEKLIQLSKDLDLDENKFSECLTQKKYLTEISNDLEDASSIGATGTPTFFIGKSTSTGEIDGVKIIGAQPFSVFKDLIDQQILGSDSQEELVKVSIDDDPVLGESSAPITMIEFSDYECPFCKRYFDSSFSQIKKDFVDTGKLKIVFRDLPLSFHDPAATSEALAANCAKELGGDEVYFKYHDLIFKQTKSNGQGI